MLWKELQTGRRSVWRLLVQVIFVMLALDAVLVPLGYILETYVFPVQWQTTDWRAFSDVLEVALTVTALCLLPGVLVHAAGSVVREREQQTLDGLLTTPQEARAILRAKVFASILSGRWFWFWLAVFWVEGLILAGPTSGSVPLLLFGPLLLLVWLVYAALLAAVGLWFSVACRTSLRALVGSMLALLGMCLGPWLLFISYLPLLFTAANPGPVVSHVSVIELTWTPPAALLGMVAAQSWTVHGANGLARWYLSARPESVLGPWLGTEEAFMPYFATTGELEFLRGLGLLYWLLVAYMFWRRALARFRAQTCHSVPMRPELAAADTLTEPEICNLLRRSGRRAALRPWLAVGPMAILVIALPFGVIFYQSEQAKAELRHAIAEVDAADPRWRLEALEDDRAVLPDERNSARVVQRAKTLTPAQLFGPKTLPSGEVIDIPWKAVANLPRSERLDSHLAQSLREDLEKAQAALAQARSLVDLPEGRHAIAWAPDGWSTLMPHLDNARDVANLLQFDSNLRAHDGEIDAALSSVRAALNVGRSIGDEPALISFYVRMTICALTIDALERALAQGQATDTSLENVQALLAREEAEPVLLNALRGERAIGHRFWSYLETEGASKFATKIGLANQPMPGLERLGTTTYRQAHANALRNVTQAVAIVRLPVHKREDLFIELERNARERMRIGFVANEGFVKHAERERFVLAMIRSAAVAMALERFRLANGDWPQRLDELCPRFLDAVPLDPCDGKPLRYVRKEVMVVVYSIGQNGQDDGGIIPWRWYADDGDVGFRLWHVPQRRQPPRNPEMGPPAPHGANQ